MEVLVRPGSLVYGYANLPGGRELINEVDAAAQHVHGMLSGLDLKAAAISDYNARYLKSKIDDPYFNWSINTYMMCWLIAMYRGRRNRLVFVDFGGGSGTVSFLAKTLGIATVIYCDIYDVSCRDAHTIGSLIGCDADHYVNGDLPELIAFLHGKGLDCDMLASHDCIEHVYDIEGFLMDLKRVSDGKLLVWLSSSANTLRPKTRRDLTRVHIQAEYEDRKPEWGHKERDTARSFLSVRREMVHSEAGGLGPDDVNILALRTRGMREDDIIKAVRSYVEEGVLPPEPEHPTNTCDPYTGNWAERFMDPFRLRDIQEREGFSVEVLPGYWSHDQNSRLKAMAKSAVNVWLSLLGARAMRLAPYYVLAGVSRG
jgi:SAM-dependent methyltransferase